jgi:transglutaminase-like putative cysteine protease
MQTAPLDLTIRCGLDFAYESSAPTPIILLLQPRLDRWQRIEKEQFTFHPDLSVREHEDAHGNIVRRLELPPGRATIRHDAFVSVPSMPENFEGIGEPIPISELSNELIPYTLPSRYCDSDRLMDFAFQHFGHIQHGLPRVQAICDWVHTNIEYRFGAGSPYTSASEVIAQRYGVCRDFAHSAVALCRCFNLPARYVTG